MLANEKPVHKMEVIHKRPLRKKRSGQPNMNLRRTKSLCIEIYKTTNNLNPEFMRDLPIVYKTNRVQRQQSKLNLEILKSNQVKNMIKIWEGPNFYFDSNI